MIKLNTPYTIENGDVVTFNEGKKGSITGTYGEGTLTGTLPGGYRYYLGMFANIGSNGNWWFTSELNDFSAYFFYLISNDGKAHFHHNYKKNGYSLRCLKD
ncbi:MAG: hypothetical protein ACK452_05580 [Bacteroidota bacterium]|jgi:uncharacterized protein (TIGR02145 family)